LPIIIAFVYVTTHDIELAQILGSDIENCHFQEFFDETTIKFDYKIYSGKSTTRNAIKLLGILGYDESIVKLIITYKFNDIC